MKDVVKEFRKIIEETNRLTRQLAYQMSLTRKLLELEPEYKIFRGKKLKENRTVADQGDCP